MSMSAGEANALTLKREIDWFRALLETRITLYFQKPGESGEIRHITPPSLEGDDSEYARTVTRFGLGFDERVILILALLPHTAPHELDTLFIRNRNLDRGFTEFGGWKGNSHGGFLPTCETAAFILAGDDLKKRFEIIRLFEADHVFTNQGILRIESSSGNEPLFCGALLITADYLSRFTTGSSHQPGFSASFPARLITTPLAWSDLVLGPEVLEEIHTLTAWLEHSRVIMEEWGLASVVKPGYRALFYGPPGTGKTLTATLIGTTAGVDVYRIDLSMVVSKYIGETEKNLASVFDQAQNRNWILFFDEADALFGRRTQTSSSNDRYANQEVSYLLQRVEDFPGMVILATNLKANIDEAFARRFQSSVYFPLPDAEQRLRLWQGVLGKGCPLGDDVDLPSLAEGHEISGGAIANVARYGAIRALRRGDRAVTQEDLLKGISRELMKEGRTI